MRKKEVDKIVMQLLKDSNKTYTRAEIMQIFNNNLKTDQLIRIYKRYMYLKEQDIIL